MKQSVGQGITRRVVEEVVDKVEQRKKGDFLQQGLRSQATKTCAKNQKEMGQKQPRRVLT